MVSWAIFLFSHINPYPFSAHSQSDHLAPEKESTSLSTMPICSQSVKRRWQINWTWKEHRKENNYVSKEFGQAQPLEEPSDRLPAVPGGSRFNVLFRIIITINATNGLWYYAVQKLFLYRLPVFFQDYFTGTKWSKRAQFFIPIE